MKREYKSFDFLLLALVCGLAVFGIIVIGSATHVTLGGAVDDYYGKQKFWFATGLVLLALAAFIDYHFICKFYIAIYVLNIFLLILVLFIGGDDGTGTARWIRYKEVGIQPSEFSKIFMILFLAAFLDKKSAISNKAPIVLLMMVLVGLPVILIGVQPSLSAALVVGFVSMAIIFVGMLSYRYILPALAVAVPAVFLTILDVKSPDRLFADKVLGSYQVGRIMLWLNPDKNDPKYYQTGQSITAIASGQLEGKGIHNGVINVPFAHNDFIFAVIGEEFGFIGCMVLLGFILLVVLKCLLIAQNSVDTTGKLIATGVAVMLAFQTFVNVGVSTGLLPNTGTPLPFISYGGSAMWVYMVAIGMCINVGMTKSKSFFEG